MRNLRNPAEIERFARIYSGKYGNRLAAVKNMEYAGSDVQPGTKQHWRSAIAKAKEIHHLTPTKAEGEGSVPADAKKDAIAKKNPGETNPRSESGPRTEFTQAQRKAAAEAALKAPAVPPDLVEGNRFFDFAFPHAVAVDLPIGAVRVARVRLPSAEGKPVEMKDVEFYIERDGKEFLATQSELTKLRETFAPLFELANDKIAQGKLNPGDLGGALHSYAAASGHSARNESATGNVAIAGAAPDVSSIPRAEPSSSKLAIMVRGENGYRQVSIDELSDGDKQKILQERFKLLNDLVEAHLKDVRDGEQTEDRRLLESLSQEMKTAGTAEDQLAVLAKFERNVKAAKQNESIADKKHVATIGDVHKMQSRGGILRVMEQYSGATGLAVAGLTLYGLLSSGETHESKRLKLPK